MKLQNRLTNIIAALLLILTFGLATSSIINDSLTFDETAHIGAGYSYLTKLDYRVNPEHPPLIKDLAALPLLFLNLKFPEQSFEKVNPAIWWTQFDFANDFIYKSGNNPDQILIFSRLPLILLFLILGWLLYFWSKKLLGNWQALLVLTFFCFSPTFLANGRLVTTDVGAALGVVLAIYFWLRFLKEPNKLNITLAGLIFGFSILIKFNLILLIFLLGFITIIWAWLKKGNILKYIYFGLLAGILGMVLVVWPIYRIHILNYPADLQLEQTKEVLLTAGLPKTLKDINILLAENEILRPFGEFLLGLNMATNRTTAGNTTYFMGTISAEGRLGYFPMVYLIKVPLAFHIITILVLLFAAYKLKFPFWKNTGKRLKKWINDYFPQFSMIIFLIIYWATSLSGNLNIGIRHILPTFPFIYILLVWGISHLFENLKGKKGKMVASAILIILVSWYCFCPISIFPYFIAYFNELAGGPDNGYKFVVDSNLDWGQDLKRLTKWVDKNLPADRQVYLDYFGGGDPRYYLGEKYIPWDRTRTESEFPKGNYLAVSATQMQGQRANPVLGFDQETFQYFWLNKFEPPITKIGYSIFVYYIPD